MVKIYAYIFILLVLPAGAWSQSYTSYFTGNPNDIQTNPEGGICLMGGASEHDEAMKWFLQRADGGDILVLRASGSDGYNDYLYSQLGITVNSVETIVCNSPAASNDPYVQERVAQAEAIWFAGGDQWNYVSFWRNSPIDSLINLGIPQRNIVLGGTSAGMAIQGAAYFSAENGTVTSTVALANPYGASVTPVITPFIQHAILSDVITDTHYDNPDRRGRHVAFIARLLTDHGWWAKGIACDEYTAVCIDENGLARVYGDYPNYDEDAYFIQANCELDNWSPENCIAGVPLNWDRGGQALVVYRVKGTNGGSNTFDLSTWQTGTGGAWEYWSVSNGILQTTAGLQLNCPLNAGETELFQIVYPNPAKEYLKLEIVSHIDVLSILDDSGRIVMEQRSIHPASISLDVKSLKSGSYFIQCRGASSSQSQVWVKE
jgi:cyanophycinase-like exopeptidase